MTSAEKQKIKKYIYSPFIHGDVKASGSVPVDSYGKKKKQQQQQQNVNKISTWVNVYLKYATIQVS